MSCTHLQALTTAWAAKTLLFMSVGTWSTKIIWNYFSFNPNTEWWGRSPLTGIGTLSEGREALFAGLNAKVQLLSAMNALRISTMPAMSGTRRHLISMTDRCASGATKARRRRGFFVVSHALDENGKD